MTEVPYWGCGGGGEICITAHSIEGNFGIFNFFTKVSA